MSSKELIRDSDIPRLKILLVEDNVDDAFLLARHLNRNGFEADITRVETGPAMAEALVGTPAPDAVLADYNLPDFSGPAALQMLHASGLEIPFIMLSGAMSETTAVESMRAGAQDYVTKQNLSRLIPALERELKEASDRRQKVAAVLALQASEDRFHRLVEGMPLGLIIADGPGNIVYTNEAANRLFKIERAEQGSIRWEQLCPSLEPQSFFASSNVGPNEPFEASCQTLDGQAIEVLVGIALLNPDAPSDRRQLAAFMADLTLQKANEELLRRTEKLAVAGRLAASIAHEINNPLEAITNLLYLLGTSKLEDSAREYLELAVRELDRVAQITVQTLRFHRRSSASVLTSIAELAESVLPLFEPRLRMVDAELATRFRPTPPVLVHDGEVRQVIANLISNAVDALKKGGKLQLRLRSAHHPRTGVQGVVLTVADTGTGMSAETLERIFEPFFSTKGDTGTGLGLWVSLEIVEKHGGSLRARSRQSSAERAGGTVFRFFLPIAFSVSPLTPQA